jgi:Ca2+-binding EF-hand superfamily protein
VKQLLLLLDADKNGRISKKEWMSFMEAEFNSLDKDGNGELDVKELQQSKFAIRQGSSSNASR